MEIRYTDEFPEVQLLLAHTQGTIEEVRDGDDVWGDFIDGAGGNEGNAPPSHYETREDIEFYLPICDRLFKRYTEGNTEQKVLSMLVIRALDRSTETYGEHLSLAQAMAYAGLPPKEVQDYLDIQFDPDSEAAQRERQQFEASLEEIRQRRDPADRNS